MQHKCPNPDCKKDIKEPLVDFLKFKTPAMKVPCMLVTCPYCYTILGATSNPYKLLNDIETALKITEKKILRTLIKRLPH
jgi:hypothetical protein